MPRGIFLPTSRWHSPRTTFHLKIRSCLLHLHRRAVPDVLDLIRSISISKRQRAPTLCLQRRYNKNGWRGRSAYQVPLDSRPRLSGRYQGATVIPFWPTLPTPSGRPITTCQRGSGPRLPFFRSDYMIIRRFKNESSGKFSRWF